MSEGPRDRLRGEARRLALAISFLTRLPVRAVHGPNGLAPATRWFALTGALIGVITGGVLLVAASVLPMPLAAGISLLAGMLVTGALHEDGLADTVDGLSGGATRARALEIMRDSRIGSHGALALLLSVGLRWGALAEMAPMQGALALIIAHAGSRAALAAVPLLARYAREQGLGRALDATRPADAGIALGTAAVIALLAAGGAGLIALALSLALGGAVLAFLVRRLGGYTGDGLGTVQQVIEIAVLLMLAA